MTMAILACFCADIVVGEMAAVEIAFEGSELAVINQMLLYWVSTRTKNDV
ncbi:protein of unknown function [Xenorhabdus nematophila AN6/1]|nr:hypothetical protein XNA1_2680004 [Xenorhabdus nematophila str. Anatoliense]CEE93349.1 hypothetical protein XNA1_370004 [Xenorhabdus nematophila str. Anatoliense]CEF30581.1 hypothetical protein XNW1_2700006 [Xenorhabdus nematophila str. Websteri]CEF31260.1 hypothetical protein XNW1_330006 [Xenorhabdus nematophila str. Websteri]CEK21900.1 protein of unknown function [Xenorhabdus nematophila AN6/1]